VVGVSNNYFGGDVSVAGLLTGSDLLRVRDQIKGEFLLIPKQMLKSDEAIMLDGMKIEEVARSLGLPIHAVNLGKLVRLLSTLNRDQ
jgi:NifB/MoaA-like Fe-S oxidoreductase